MAHLFTYPSIYCLFVLLGLAGVLDALLEFRSAEAPKEIRNGFTVAFLALGVLLQSFFLSLILTNPVHETDCLSNLKKYGQAVALYAADHDDRLPTAARWQTALLKYQPEILTCNVTGDKGYCFNAQQDAQPLDQPNREKVWLVHESSQDAVNEVAKTNAHFLAQHGDPLVLGLDLVAKKAPESAMFWKSDLKQPATLPPQANHGLYEIERRFGNIPFIVSVSALTLATAFVPKNRQAEFRKYRIGIAIALAANLAVVALVLALR